MVPKPSSQHFLSLLCAMSYAGWIRTWSLLRPVSVVRNHIFSSRSGIHVWILFLWPPCMFVDLLVNWFWLFCCYGHFYADKQICLLFLGWWVYHIWCPEIVFERLEEIHVVHSMGVKSRLSSFGLRSFLILILLPLSCPWAASLLLLLRQPLDMRGYTGVFYC